MWPLLVSTMRTHIVLSILVLLEKKQGILSECTVFPRHVSVHLLSLFHDLYKHCCGSTECIMMKLHNNAEGKYFKADTWQ